MKIRGSTFIPVMALCALSYCAGAQSAGDAGCALQPPAFTSDAPNIFNDQQEQWLGDALAEYTETDMRLAPQPAGDMLTLIGEKLLAVLPSTGVHYRFRMYDSGEINAFSTAGGRVYISRKLIAAVKNEDELAGVMAHEIGHIRTHQSAIEFTRTFRIRLGVTEVSDRADIYAKVHRYFSTPAKAKEEEEGDEVNEEIIADHVALYALVRAGYATQAFADFMNESMMNKGKTGNWLTDAFGITHDESKRYRSALKLIGELPAGCREQRPGANEAFSAWLKNVKDERVQTAAAGLVGDQPVKLDPPLRPSPWRIRFSPDGHMILVQDEYNITIVDKDAGKTLFRIDAPEANAAQFTPDSKSVVFHDDKLRVEQWSVADAKRTSAKELVVYDGCFETLLSPDGKTFVCAFGNRHGDVARIGVRMLDVESGQVFYENQKFFEPGEYSGYELRIIWAMEGYGESSLMNMMTSPDGKYLLLAAGDKTLAYDLFSRQPVALGGKMKNLSQTRMSFLGPDELYEVERFDSGKNMYIARIFSFPSGEIVKETEIANQLVEAVSKGRALIVSPLKDYSVGLFDPMQGKVLAASKLASIDMWDSTIAMEDAVGGVAVAQLDPTGLTNKRYIPLTLGPMPVVKSGAFSPDGKFLAISMRNRAEIWNLETGKQVGLIRPFHEAWFDKEDRFFGQFQKYMDKDPAELRLSLDPLSTKDLAKLDDQEWQYHNLELRLKPIGKGKGTRTHATLEVKNMETQTVAWSRDYPDETPVCWPAEDDRMVLAWDMGTSTAKAEIKGSLALQKEMEEARNHKKGLLIETVSPETGAPLEKVVIPEADLSHGWSDERWARVSGEYVLLHGEHENTVIYRLDTGIKVGEFFGYTFASDAATGIAVSVTSDDSMLLVDERTGKELKRFSLGSPVRAARIVSGKEKSLLVLTADQTVHRLPLPQPAAPQ